ncbi:hypothetical protein [Natroniella sulfidigena]|nr:hypothetical protein [Natroniella sulfidigena]
MKIDFLFAWSKNEHDDVKSVSGGFKLPTPFKLIKSVFKRK